MGTTVYLGLGGNLGDARAAIATALERLDRVPGVRVVRTSRLRETEPVGGPPQPRYWNGVAELDVALPPHALLAILQQLEREAGRDPAAPRNHPRPLDLDLLLWGEQRIDTRELQVPHPRMHARSFVLEPLAELGVQLPPDAARAPAHPELLHAPPEFAARCSAWLEGGCRIGLVPTMGALHAGHATLLRRARALCDRVAMSVFVNPLQFGPSEDFARYPRTLEQDTALAAQEGVDVVFAPDVSGMYGDGFCSRVAVGPLAGELEGRARPDHFGGVATVVAKLFTLARPHLAFFGQKDAQQVAILRRLVHDLGFPLALVECPTVREPDGLAMSSRNRFLTVEDRAAAPVLFAALQRIRRAFLQGERDPRQLLAQGEAVLAAEPRARVDYLELRREGDLAMLPAGPVDAGRALVAAWFGPPERTVRLIDNLSLQPQPDEEP